MHLGYRIFEIGFVDQKLCRISLLSEIHVIPKCTNFDPYFDRHVNLKWPCVFRAPSGTLFLLVSLDIWNSSGWTGPSSVGPVHQIDGPVRDLWHFWDRSEIFNFKADELISYSFVVNQSLNGMNNDGVTVRKVKKDSWRLCYRVLKGLMFII